MCKKCGLQHGRFKNGKMKKSCPTRRVSAKTKVQDGEGILGDLNEKFGKHVIRLLKPMIMRRISRNSKINNKNARRNARRRR